MFRLTTIFSVLMLFSVSVFAQLPNSNGQVWREYVVSATTAPLGVPEGSYVPHVIQNGSEIIRIVKQDTGEEAWTGRNMGLISCDERKLYVYHTPEMQARVNEIVGRFMRPETRDVQFATEVRFVTLSKSTMEQKGIEDIREPIYRYLHPIVAPANKPVIRTPGVSAYWVAKEDIPKLNEGLADLFGVATSSTAGNILTAPKMTTFNGGHGVVMDTSQTPFITDVISVQKNSGPALEPIISILDEGQRVGTFSLLSWDCRTATSDISACFSKINRLDKVVVDKSTPIGGTLQVPQYQKIEFSEQGLTWPSDGMLVVFLGGISRLAEVRREMGTPVLNKIPYVNRLFMNTAIGREAVSAIGIVTVKMIEETAPKIQQAQGNVVVR